MEENRWINLKQQLLMQVKSQVLKQTGQLTDDLILYSEKYEREFDGAWAESHRNTLNSSLENTEIVLAGEFHPFSQSQRTHLRILREYKGEKPILLCLECVEAIHQKELDGFITGDITEEQFLAAVDWDKRWSFAWQNYKPLFDLAKEKKYKVFGINKYFDERTREILKKRDIYSAQVIHQIKTSHPGTLPYVIYGEWHLAEDHLPKELKKINPAYENKILKILQNSEKLYFNILSENKLGHVEVLKNNKGHFCILSSPPWVKWQSYAIFLEQTYDEFYLDDENETSIDYTDHIMAKIRFLKKGLGLDFNYNDLEVYSSTNENIWKVFESKMDENLFLLVQEFIKKDFSFYLPKENIMFLSRPSVNHLATLAGKYLQSKLSGRKRNLVNMPDDFIFNIWVEGLSFFISKLINPNRKSETLESLKAKFSVNLPMDQERDVLLLALDQRLSEVLQAQGHRGVNRRFSPKEPSTYLEASKILGGMLGEKLFLAFQSKIVSENQILQWLKVDVDSQEFPVVYKKVLKYTERIKMKKNIAGVIYE